MNVHRNSCNMLMMEVIVGDTIFFIDFLLSFASTISCHLMLARILLETLMRSRKIIISHFKNKNKNFVQVCFIHHFWKIGTNVIFSLTFESIIIHDEHIFIKWDYFTSFLSIIWNGIHVFFAFSVYVLSTSFLTEKKETLKKH